MRVGETSNWDLSRRSLLTSILDVTGSKLNLWGMKIFKTGTDYIQIPHDRIKTGIKDRIKETSKQYRLENSVLKTIKYPRQILKACFVTESF